MNNKKLGIFVLALCIFIIIAGCGNKTKTEENGGTEGASAPSTKEYIVATDANYAPFESMTTSNEFVGFDIEIMKAVADKAGIKIKLINTPWDGMFATIANGDRDILISAITITDERKKEMDFSDPYFEANQLIAVKQDSTVAKFEDLKDKVVGVQTGTTGDIIVMKLLGDDSTKIKRFDTTPLALKELENGGVNAVVADNGVVDNYVQNNSDQGFKTVTDAAFEKENYGIVVKKGNQELLDKINEGLKIIKEDGTYDEIYKKFFGE